MWGMLLFSLFPPVGAFFADRIGWLKKRPVAQGIFFGILILIVHVLSQKTANSYDFVGVLDALVMVSGLFFGIIPVCITGAIAAAVYVITNDPFWLGGCAVFVVDVSYSIIARKYIFEGKKPVVVPTILCVTLGELLNTIVFFLLEFNQPDYAIETTVISFWAMEMEISIGCGLTALVCRSVGTLQQNLLDKTVFALASLNAVCLGIFYIATDNARAKSAQRLVQGMQELTRNYNSQVQYMLRRTAYRFCYAIPELRNFSSTELKQLADINYVDEIHVLDTNGHVIGSSNPAYLRDGQSIRKNVIVCKETNNSGIPILENGFCTDYRAPLSEFYSVTMPLGDGKGFLEVVLSGARTIREYDLFVVPLLKNRLLGIDGFFMITDPDGKIILSSHHEAALTGKNIHTMGFVSANLNEREMTPGMIKFRNRWYVCMKRNTYDGRTFFIGLPLSEISYYFMILPCISILFLCFFALGTRIAMVILRKSQKNVEVLTKDRVERHKKELQLARQIQYAELRFDHPDTEYCTIDSFMEPMEEIGGDFYDDYLLSDGRMVVTIGDVSGEGVPAAFFMMKVKTALREQMLSCATLKDAVDKVNKTLCRNNDLKMFVTIWIGVLHLETGRCDYICAGHNPPLWKHDGKLEWLPGTNSPVLAVASDVNFEMRTIQFHHGDHLFLYTDGVTEAMNKQGVRFTKDRLFDVLKENRDMYITRVKEELKRFTAQEQPSDDITMLEFRYDGSI